MTVWKPGMFVSFYGGEGHKVMDTGMQLLTTCGGRVTYLGAELDGRRWKPAERMECFACVESPRIEWATTYGWEFDEADGLAPTA
ncbi:hypothetical protein [Acrocarpospora sp. B8E8]|uniref:hypothetical protein n=1 Tax=Acrocarpospora sp. B8E8 TaxID=3153572 RepID=UPI00325E7CEB